MSELIQKIQGLISAKAWYDTIIDDAGLNAEDAQEIIDLVEQSQWSDEKIEMRSLIIDLQATLRAIQNSSNSMMDDCDERRKTMGI